MKGKENQITIRNLKDLPFFCCGIVIEGLTSISVPVEKWEQEFTENKVIRNAVKLGYLEAFAAENNKKGK